MWDPRQPVPLGSPALPWQQAGWRRPSSRWLQDPFSFTLLLSKVPPGPQPGTSFSAKPQPASSPVPPSKPLDQGAAGVSSISLPSFKPPPQTQVSQGCLGAHFPQQGGGDPDDKGTLPPLPIFKQVPGQAAQENRRVFVEEFIIILSIKFLERKKSALPTSPLTAPPFTLTFFHS